MGFLVLLLFIAIVVFWSQLIDVRRHAAMTDTLMTSVKEELRELSARVLRLELAGVRTAVEPLPAHVPVPAPVPAPATASPAPTPPSPPVPTPAVASVPVPVFAPVVSPVMAAASISSRESWEMEVGTNWLNKIGVVVFIVGVALLVGYSFGHVGAAGRIGIGYALSLGMLATGVVLEHREPYRNYAYGLIAGGWAGTYFTTFAMHDVPAARILDNDLAAISLLTLVAAGMIAHSLRYRSQVVTGLAFVVAYITLSLSPLSGFATAASVPLAVSLLVVSQRFGWSGVSALGVIATYGAFAVRHATLPGGAMDPASPIPYVTLATYWLAFEGSDIIGLKSRRTVGAQAAPVQLLALNATGFVGTLLLIVPRDQPQLVAWMLFASAAAYLASAVTRAWLLPGWLERHSRNQPFDTAHASLAIGAALFAVAIGVQFQGNRLLLARLLEAQMLITAGVLLGDVWLRRFGSVAIALAAVQGWLLLSALGTGTSWFTWAPGTTSAACLLIAAACYGSRDAIHRRQETPTWFEDGFTWIATMLVATVIHFELTPAHQVLAGLIVAALLLEIARRRTGEYAYQSYGLGLVSALGMAVAFVARPEDAGLLLRWGPLPTAQDVWLVLPAGVAIAAFGAWRLSRNDGVALPSNQTAAGVALTITGTLLAIFEWRALSADVVAPAWALTGLAFVAFGAWRRQATWNPFGFALGLLAASRVALGLVAEPDPASAAISAAMAVIATLYAIAYFSGRTSTDTGSRLAVMTLAASATGVLTLLEWRLVPDVGFGFALAVTGTVAFGVGYWRRAEHVRWHGYVLLAAAGVRAAQVVLGPVVEADVSINFWLQGVIALLYFTGLVANHLVMASSDGTQEKTPDHAERLEVAVPAFLLLVATGLLSVQTMRQLRPSMITLALGAQGLASMLVGLLARSRVLRLSGLALLMTCILKLFVYDLRELEALARILSFVVLGLILLAVSWTYTKYREQIQRLL